MHLTFDLGDWAIGAVVNGFLAFRVLVSLTASGHPLVGVVTAAGGFIAGLGGAVAMDLLFQTIVSPEARASSSIDRQALIAMVTWLVGACIGWLLAGVCIGSVTLAWVFLRLKINGPQVDVLVELNSNIVRAGQDRSCAHPCLVRRGEPCLSRGRREQQARAAVRKASRSRRTFWDA